MSIGQRLKEVLKQNDLTQEELALKAGITRQTINNAVKGQNEPSGVVLSKILSAFPEISARWLLTGSGGMFESKSTGSIIKNVVSEPESSYGKLLQLEAENSKLKDELIECKNKYILLLESKK